MNETERLKAAIAAIHNHLHAGDVNAAHEACECAMDGEEVSQPNLTMPQSARIQAFSHRFNRLCRKYDIPAAFVAMLPSATKPGFVSMQMGGSVNVCKVLEQTMGRSSLYQGDHP